jgi:phosphoribosyl 1,2-cyclic phosphodiesterase
MLRFVSLGSGSSGNATVVEAQDGRRTTRLLVDCGFTPRQLELRLHRAGLTRSSLDAVFVTHEHGDHSGGVTAICQRENIPVWMSAGTHAAIGSPDLGPLLQLAGDGEEIAIGALQLCPFTVPHDAREPLQLRCSDGARALGILTDLGHATQHVLDSLAGCHALLLECNHDPDLLAASSYHPALKRRVGGLYGHLSNPDAADIARQLCHPGLALLVAAHLSAQNNRPDLAREALASASGRAPQEIQVADQQAGTGWLAV